MGTNSKTKAQSAMRAAMAKTLVNSGFGVKDIELAFGVSKSMAYNYAGGTVPSKKTREEKEDAILSTSIHQCRTKKTKVDASVQSRIDTVKRLFDAGNNIGEIATKTGYSPNFVMSALDNSI